MNLRVMIPTIAVIVVPIAKVILMMDARGLLVATEVAMGRGKGGGDILTSMIMEEEVREVEVMARTRER